MINLEKKAEELAEKYGEPWKGAEGRYLHERKALHECCPPVLGVVTDNRDPEGLGRVRVSTDMSVPGSESPWLCVAGQWKKKGSGWWVLPEIGTQALVVYTAKDRSRGYVLGYIYDRKHLPPERGGDSGTVVLEGKKVRGEIREGKDGETIILESKDGELRIELDSGKGISIRNGKGDIKIKCRSFSAESEEVTIKGEGLKSGSESVKTKASGGAALEGGGDTKLKGKNIRLKGSRGVTAEGKAAARQDDKVTGFDIHQMVVPAGTGTAVIPLPHPFIGQIKGKTSSDVKIGDKGIAVKGSEAKHNDMMHMQLPGTVKFQKGPECKGEISGGTVKSVKADGKEVAVIGSTVTTCNDAGVRDNSTVVSIGASMPMPAIVSPLACEEYRKEQEGKEKKEPQFASVKWGRTETGEGEEAELTASVKDIADGNMVTLQVFPEGSGPESGAALGVFPLTVKNGSVSARWKWESDRRGMPPEEDPVFVFTAHCAWCPWKKSENRLKVKPVRPEITKAEWKDAEGKTASKGLAGEPLKLVAETKDMEEGSGVTFTVYEEKSGKKVAETGATVKEGKAEAEWTYHYNGENLTEKPRYYYEATGNRCRKAKSGTVEIGARIRVYLKNEITYDIYGFKCVLSKDGGEAEDVYFEEGKLEKEWQIAGNYELKIGTEESREKEKSFEGKYERDISTTVIPSGEIRRKTVKISLEKDNEIVLVEDNTNPSE